MKKVISGLAALAILFVVASCGGVSEDELVGKWTVDPSTVSIELGDGIPAETKAQAKKYKADMKSEGAEEMKDVYFEFKEGGKFVISGEGESQEGTWSLDGEDLTIGMDAEGLKVELTLQVEMDGDNMTATLQGTEIVKAIKKLIKQEPRAEEMIGRMVGDDMDKAAKGTSISVTFNKK
ncbi:MAG: lipocalin-like domain-containing protein [Fluviicola sp.]